VFVRWTPLGPTGSPLLQNDPQQGPRVRRTPLGPGDPCLSAAFLEGRAEPIPLAEKQREEKKRE
jgi:hypothetical protein